MILRRAAAVVAVGLALVGAGCTSSASAGGATTSTSNATTSTTEPGELSPTAQRWVELREDNDCQGTAFGAMIEETVGSEPSDRVATPEEWTQVQRRLLPVARDYAAIKLAMIHEVEGETWPPGAQQAIDEQLDVQRARAAWLRELGAATTLDEFNAVFSRTLPMDRSPAVRYALEIPPTKEIHTAHFCATR